MDSLIQKAQDRLDEKHNDSNRPTNVEDMELEELLSNHKASIKVIGCGGGGGNTVNRIAEVGVLGTETIAINTDAQDLLYTTADKKILIGRDLAKGLGAGGQPKIGRDSAKESEKEIRAALQGSDMVFITCGLGGGTGTGSAPVVAEISKKSGALTVAIVTMPFKMEGGRRTENAIIGLELLNYSTYIYEKRSWDSISPEEHFYMPGPSYKPFVVRVIYLVFPTLDENYGKMY